MLSLFLLFLSISFALKLSFKNIYYQRFNHINCKNSNSNIENEYNDNDNEEIYNNNNNQQAQWSSVTGLRQSDLQQDRDLDLILTERAQRFYDPKVFILT